MIALILIPLLIAAGALTAYGMAVRPVATYCAAMALTGTLLAVMAVELAEAGLVPLAGLMAAAGVAAQLVGVAAAHADAAAARPAY